MIECLRDEDGNITAVCEWLLFNEKAQLDDDGKFLLVGEVEINNLHRGNGTIKEFILRIEKKCPWVEKIFFFREKKYPGRKVRVYNKEQILRRAKWVEEKGQEREQL